MEEIRLTTRNVWNHVNNGINYPSTGAGILPSTVLQGFGIRRSFRTQKAAASERKLQDEIGAFVDLTESLPIEVHPTGWDSVKMVKLQFLGIQPVAHHFKDVKNKTKQWHYIPRSSLSTKFPRSEVSEFQKNGSFPEVPHRFCIGCHHRPYPVKRIMRMSGTFFGVYAFWWKQLECQPLGSAGWWGNVWKKNGHPFIFVEYAKIGKRGWKHYCIEKR